jgi:ABC-type sugar transport system ATPase subunit
MSEPYLEMKGIAKHFSGTYVLNNVDLRVSEGEILALMGANGAGKSTLMNILGGVLEPNEGTITIGGTPRVFKSVSDSERAGIGFIHQELALCTTMTVAENMFINRFPMKGGRIDTRRMREESQAALRTLGCSIDVNKSVRSLSAGDRQLTEIARVLLSNTKILIFDEPTSSLALEEKSRFFEIIRALQKKQKVIIYITHFLDEIFSICDQVQVLRNGETSGGGPLQDFTHHDIVNMMVGELDIRSDKKRNLAGAETVLKVENLSRAGVLDSISFELHRGEILGLWGLMGSGRTEILRALSGLDPIDTGQISVNVDGALVQVPPKRVKRAAGLITENRREDGLFLPLNVTENIASANLLTLLSKNRFTVVRQKEEQSAKRQVDALNIKVTSLEQKAGTLSGGNQQKVILARWLSKAPRIFFMDEPTRGVDVGAKSEIHTIIKDLSEKGYSLLVVSSEIEEMMELCHRYLVIHDGRIVRELPGEAAKKDLMIWAAGAGDKASGEE